jgi:hypothetical protein
MKDDRPRRRREEKSGEEKAKSTEELKTGVAAIEGKEEKSEVAPTEVALSDEELDKKLNAALEGDAKEA